MKVELPETTKALMSAEQEADDLRELIANERLRHMDERNRLGEKVLEEQRLRYEVEQEDAVALADMKAQRDALADALEAYHAFLFRSDVMTKANRQAEYERLHVLGKTALRAAGRFP